MWLVVHNWVTLCNLQNALYIPGWFDTSESKYHVFETLWDPSLRSLTWHWNCPLVDCKRVPGGYLNSLIMLVSGLPYRYCEWFIYRDRSTGDVLLNNEWELQINSNPGRIHKWYTTLVVILSIDRVWLFKKYVSNANAMHYICFWYGQRWAPWYKKLYT